MAHDLIVSFEALKKELPPLPGVTAFFDKLVSHIVELEDQVEELSQRFDEHRDGASGIRNGYRSNPELE